MGQSSLRKEKEEELLAIIPKDLFNHKFLMNPIRLSIMKLLYLYNSMSSVEIKSNLGITWQEYSTHIRALKLSNYISVTDKFVDGLKRQFIYLEDPGRQDFEAVMEHLKTFVRESSRLEIFMNDDEEVDDLYPKA